MLTTKRRFLDEYNRLEKELVDIAFSNSPADMIQDEVKEYLIGLRRIMKKTWFLRGIVYTPQEVEVPGFTYPASLEGIRIFIDSYSKRFELKEQT